MFEYPSMDLEDTTAIWAGDLSPSGSVNRHGHSDGETIEPHWADALIHRPLDLDVHLFQTSEDVYHQEETTNPWTGWGNVDYTMLRAGVPWSAHSNGVPYNDNDLGVLETQYDLADWGSPSPGPAPIVDMFAVDHDPVGAAAETTAEDGLNVLATRSGYLSLLNAELLDSVFMYLPPDIDFIALNGTWRHGRGKVAMDAIVNLMCTASWIYNAAMGNRRLWAAVVPAARSRDTWLTAMSRTASAPLRLAYRHAIATALLNEQLPRAVAVYVGDECPWMDFATFLGDASTLETLQVLFLRPNRQNMPAGPLPSATQALSVPSMLVCETSIPLILAGAHRLERLGCFYHTSSQLTDIVTSRPALKRLDIAHIRGDDAVDLTALISRATPDSLEFLRIRAGPSRTTSLQRTVTRVQLPCLQVLDVGGPVWLAAPFASFARIYNTHAEESLDMLKEMPSVARVHLRWRSPEEDFPWIGDRVSLPQLRHLFLDSFMCAQTETFLRGLCAPRMEIMQMFGDMRAAPNFTVAAALRAEILEVLGAHEADLDNLRSALQESQEHLSDAGHGALANRLNTVLVPPLAAGWGDQVVEADEGHGLEEVRDVAAAVAADLALIEDAQPLPHAGVLLGRVVTAALATLSPLEDDGQPDTDLHIFEDAKGLQFQAHTRASTFCLRFTMLHAGDYVTIGNARHLQPTDSAAFGLARTLFGLAPLRPRRMHVRGDPIRRTTAQNGDDDVHMLRTVLRTYTWVDTLHIDFSHEYPGRQLIDLLSDSTVLPGLSCVKVTAPRRLNRFDTTWDALGAMIIERDAGGRRLQELVLAGTLCLRKAYAERLDSAVDNFVPQVKCGHLRQDSCTVCGWRVSQNVDVMAQTS